MDELLTVAEVAERMKLNPPTVRNWIDRGELPALRVGSRRVRIRASDLDAFVTPVIVEPPPEPEPEPERPIEEEEDEPQPLVPGQPTATGEIPIPEPPPKVQRRPRAPRKTAGDGTQKKRVSRPRKKPPVV